MTDEIHFKYAERFNVNIRRITRFAYVLVITFLAVGLSACDQLLEILSEEDMPQIEGNVPQLEGLSGDIPIGVVLPSTGQHVSSFGVPMRRSFELALEEINNAQHGDARIRLIVEDDLSTAEGAVEAFNKLINRGDISVILGPATSGQTEKAFPVARDHQIVAISPTSAKRGLSAISNYVFRTALTTDILIPHGVKVTYEELRYQRAATMYDESDSFSSDSDEALREILAARDIEVLEPQTFRSDETNFNAQLTRIKELNPDIIFVSSLPPVKAKILMQGRELGIPFSVPFVLRTLTSENVLEAGPAAEGAITFTGWGSAADAPGNEAFVQKYRAKHGIPPNNYAAQSYAAFYILAEAIANVQSTEASSIREALANIRDFDTVVGRFSFNDVGDADYTPFVLIVENGELKFFE